MIPSPLILYKFASRSRREKFFAAIDNIQSLSRHDNYVILATLDDDDGEMNTLEVRQRLSSYEKIIVDWGTSKNKIHAINRGMENLEKIPFFDILIVMSDDMAFIKEGFDLDIIQDMKNHFPNYDGILHYPDGSPNSHILTMSILGRKWFQYTGSIYPEVYDSVCCDMEVQDVAIACGKLVFIEKNILSHNHPAWKKAEMDAQYRKTEDPAVHVKDRKMYDERKASGFNISDILHKIKMDTDFLLGKGVNIIDGRVNVLGFLLSQSMYANFSIIITNNEHGGILVRTTGITSLVEVVGVLETAKNSMLSQINSKLTVSES